LPSIGGEELKKMSIENEDLKSKLEQANTTLAVLEKKVKTQSDENDELKENIKDEQASREKSCQTKESP